jgi:hypothetical protein
MKHKHYECIVAWAEGKQVQFCSDGGGWFDCEPHTNLSLFPNFSLDYSYRIKPESKPDYYQQYWVDENGIPYTSGVANLRLHFDGETGKLKKAEVLK